MSARVRNFLHFSKFTITAARFSFYHTPQNKFPARIFIFARVRLLEFQSLVQENDMPSTARGNGTRASRKRRKKKERLVTHNASRATRGSLLRKLRNRRAIKVLRSACRYARSVKLRNKGKNARGAKRRRECTFVCNTMLTRRLLLLLLLLLPLL